MYKRVIMEWEVEVVKDFAPKFLHSVLCLVTQSCPTLCEPVDYSQPGSSVHGDSPGRNNGVGCHVLLHSAIC